MGFILYLQLKPEFATLLGTETRFDTITNAPYDVPVYDWNPAILIAANAVKAMNVDFADNPLFVNPDALQLIPATVDVPEHWEGEPKHVFNSAEISRDNGLVTIFVPNYESIWLSLLPVGYDQYFTVCLGTPAEAGKLI